MSQQSVEPRYDPSAAPGQAIHATAILVGEAGIIIRGASGAGKSSIALAVLDLAAARGRFARLIGDDRVTVRALNGRVIVGFHPAVAGKIERRTAGILDVPYEERAIVRLIVDIVDVDRSCGIPPRLPATADQFIEIAATPLPRFVLPASAAPAESAAYLFREFLRIGDGR